MKIGDNVKKIRKERKLTQSELAKRMGISRSYLSDIENNRKNPSKRTLDSLAEKLDVSFIYLTTLEYNQNDRLAFTHNLRRIRTEKGFSIQEVAEESGIDPEYLIEIELGEHGVPSPILLKKLSKGLGVSWLYLMKKAKHFNELFKNNLSDDLLQLRFKHGFTIEVLSEKSNVPEKIIKMIEMGYSPYTDLEYVPSPERIEKILSVYGMSLDEFFSSGNVTEKEYYNKYEEYLKNSSFMDTVRDSKDMIMVYDEKVDLLKFYDEEDYMIDLGHTKVTLTPTYKGEELNNTDLEKMKQLLEIYFKD